MSFFVMAQQRRFRIRYRNCEPFFYAFVKRPARRVFKEEFATRGGQRLSASWSSGRRYSRVPEQSPARPSMKSSAPQSGRS